VIGFVRSGEVRFLKKSMYNRKKVYTPLFNLFFNFEESFYKRNSSGEVINLDEILSGDLKAPYNIFKAIDNSFYNNFKIINDLLIERILEDREGLGKDKKAFLKLRVDLINFFIFLRIQMDKIAELTTYFYDDEEITGKKRGSFHRQKNWWLKEGEHLDKDYANIIKSKTKWFDELNNEMGLRDGVVHKNMNIHIDTKNYELKGAIIKKTKGHLTVGETEEVLSEMRKHLEGFYDFCREYEVYFLNKIKSEIKFKEKDYWYDSESVETLFENSGLMESINYDFMQ